MPSLITVAETAEYIRCTQRLLSAAERMEVVEYLAANPQAGDLMQGTGGDRKPRGTALVLLNVIAKEPQAVLRAVERA